MLRPSERVAHSCGFLWPRCGTESFCDLKKQFLGYAAGAFDHFRRVAGEVSLQNLVYAVRILKRVVALTRTEVRTCHLSTIFHVATLSKIFFSIWLRATVRICPGLRVIDLAFGIPSREKSIQILGVLESLADDDGGIGEVHYIFAKLLAVLEDVVD